MYVQRFINFAFVFTGKENRKEEGGRRKTWGHGRLETFHLHNTEQTCYRGRALNYFVEKLWLLPLSAVLETNFTSKRQHNPITRLDRPWEFQEVDVPRFQDDGHTKVVRFSTLAPAAFTPQEIFLVLIYVHPASWTMGTGSFSGDEVRPERAANYLPSSSAAVMEE